MVGKKKKIGVLALQGAFHLHKPHIEALGAEYVECLKPEDFAIIDALILPGGESGVMLKLIEISGISQALLQTLQTKPCWGICAGAILMAKTVVNPRQKSLAVMDCEIERNSYGRQMQSRYQMIWDYEASLIRAPRILSYGLQVKVRGSLNGDPVWIESGNLMITTFHPETNLKAPSPWHQKLIAKQPS